MNRKNLLFGLGTLLLGLLLGALLFRPAAPKSSQAPHAHKPAAQTTYTCSMHPQIRQNEPGNCPICGMELIPVSQASASGVDPRAIAMTPTAMQLANVQTATVGPQPARKEVLLNGEVQEDARRVYAQTTHIPGRIEKLMVNFTGQQVSAGQVLALVYAPDLITAQEELFQARKVRQSQPALFRAALDKLRNWKLTESQVQRILAAEEPIEHFPIVAQESGYVLSKLVHKGDYLQKGEKLYELVDLSRVWVMFDIYESDLPWVEVGDQVSFTVNALPGEQFRGRINYLDPVIDPQTRVAKARVEVANPQRRLMPEMFARGVVTAKLEQTPGLVIPQSAVMWTGRRSVVYVKQQDTQKVAFAMREVVLGPELEDSYLVMKGLCAGEEIAVHGTFSIDAAAQLAGKPSMMNPDGGVAMTGHDHGQKKTPEASPPKAAPASSPDTRPAKAALKPALEAYFALKEALVGDDTAQARLAADQLAQALNQIGQNTLESSLPPVWQEHRQALQQAVEMAAQAEDIAAIRRFFVDISAQMATIIRRAKPVQQPLYLQYCPMANENEGAYWLSRKVEVHNPYYGAAMLNCGEVKATLE